MNKTRPNWHSDCQKKINEHRSCSHCNLFVCLLAKGCLSCVITAELLSVSVSYWKWNDLLIMCRHNHAHRPWRSLLGLTCMSDGLMCQNLFLCCPDLFRPFYSDRMNIDLCHFTDWAASREAASGSQLSHATPWPLALRVHVGTHLQSSSSCLRSMMCLLEADLSVKWHWSCDVLFQFDPKITITKNQNRERTHTVTEGRII